MTQFLIVDPRRKTADPVIAESFDEALGYAGLTPGAVDHGTVWRGLGIVVAEYGLFEPVDKMAYFSIDRRLYAGNALLYAIDANGRTIDLQYGRRWFGRWYDGVDEIEQAIRRGEIERPAIKLQGDTKWRWPDPRPDLTPIAEAMGKHEGTVVVDGDTIIQKLKP